MQGRFIGIVRYVPWNMDVCITRIFILQVNLTVLGVVYLFKKKSIGNGIAT